MINTTAYFQLLAKEINDTPSSWSFSISFMTTKLFENEISEFNEKGLHTFKKNVAAFSILYRHRFRTCEFFFISEKQPLCSVPNRRCHGHFWAREILICWDSYSLFSYEMILRANVCLWY